MTLMARSTESLLYRPGHEVPVSFGNVALADHEHFLANTWSPRGKYCGRFIHRPGQVGLYLFMHQAVIDRMGLYVPPGCEIDHANWEGMDNRRENLRVFTHKQNTWHRQMNPNNTSGYTGVTRDNRNGCWVAHLGRLYLGRFDTREQAAEARRRGFHRMTPIVIYK